jgi:hypothetical protein
MRGSATARASGVLLATAQGFGDSLGLCDLLRYRGVTFALLLSSHRVNICLDSRWCAGAHGGEHRATRGLSVTETVDRVR